MFILAWLVLLAIVWGIGLAVFHMARAHMRTYTLFSLVGATSVFTLFMLVSVWMSLMRLGEAYSLSIPQDYFARGALGVLVRFVGMASVLMPLATAWLMSRQGLNLKT